MPGRHNYEEVSAHRQVIGLLSAMKDAVRVRDSASAERLSDQIELLTAAYMAPSSDCRWRDYHLTKTESRIASMLAARQGKCVTNESLLNAVCYDRPEVDWSNPGTIDTHMVRVKRKLAGIVKIERIFATGWILRFV